METCICKVYIGEEQATGFFCKIPFPTTEKMLPVFITNNHVINGKLLNQNNATIRIDIKAENGPKILNLNNRIKYASEEYDTTIFEIKESDKINNFLEQMTI